MNYVIVGNGIIGLTAAFRLSQRLSGNETVTIIGPEERTGSATLAAAAMLNSFAGIDAYSLKSVAEFARASDAVGVGNCTDGLILCLKSAGVGAGDEVITSPMSYLGHDIDHCHGGRHGGVRGCG